MAAILVFYQKPACTTCRKAKALLESLHLEFTSRDLDKQSLSEAELDALIGDRDYTAFLNTRNVLYRERKMSVKKPSRPQALELMAKHPNLIRRPLLVHGSGIILGLDEAAYRRLAKR